MHRATRLLSRLAAVGVLAACQRAEQAPGPCQSSKPPGIAQDLDVAKCLAAAPIGTPTRVQQHPVVFYLDKSASIQGFLDPAYPTRIPTDFRSVLDKVLVELHPVTAYGYGESVRQIDPNLGETGNKAFYSDRDTRMEQALSLVKQDTQLSDNHVLVGDARRGNPDAANGQFSAMREVAQAWVDRGGTFATAVSFAPFRTVESDPSGCRRGNEAARTDTRQTCPLYAFAFIAPGDEMRVLGALASVFDDLFAWPLPSIPEARARVQTANVGTEITVEPTWAQAQDGAPIARAGGVAASNNAVNASIGIDSSDELGLTLAKLVRGERFHMRLTAKPLLATAAAQDWANVDGALSIIRARDDSKRSLSIVTRGARSAKSIVRVDLVPTGAPAWLDDVDAADASDVLRTYGLGRLFEPFRARASSSAKSALHVYFVVN